MDPRVAHPPPHVQPQPRHHGDFGLNEQFHPVDTGQSRQPLRNPETVISTNAGYHHGGPMVTTAGGMTASAAGQPLPPHTAVTSASAAAGMRAETKRTRFASKDSVQYSAMDARDGGQTVVDPFRHSDFHRGRPDLVQDGGHNAWPPLVDGYADDLVVAPPPAPSRPNPTTSATTSVSGGGGGGRPRFTTPLTEAAALLTAASEGRPLPLDVREVQPRAGGAAWLPGEEPMDGEKVLLRGGGAAAADDGFAWRQLSRTTEAYRGNLVDATLHLSGSGFRRECFHMDDLLLIIYSGDPTAGERNTGSQRRRGRAQQAQLAKEAQHHVAQSQHHRPMDKSQPPHSQSQPPQQSRALAKPRLQPDAQLKHHHHHQLEEPRNLLAALRLSPPPPHTASSTTDLSLLSGLAQAGAGRPSSATLTAAASATLLRQASPSPLPLTAPAVRAMEDLLSLSEELAGGKVVKNLTVFPSLQLTLVHPDMTREFETCCKLLDAHQLASTGQAAAAAAVGGSSAGSSLGPAATSADPLASVDDDGCAIKLFYDTTFAFGRIYATLLTFVNGCSEGDPVMPLAVNLHERKFKSSHQLFWARIVGDLPALQKYRFPLIIDDAEPAVHLAVRTQAPNLVQLEAWTHRFRDVDTYLRSRGYGDEAIRYFKACVSYLLRSESKQAMHDRFRKEFESVWPKDFVVYYRQKLLPRSGRLGQWAMRKMRIRDQLFTCPHTNPQVEFHSLCRDFAGWDRLDEPQLVRAFYFLFLFYVSEAHESRATGDGPFRLKRHFADLQQPHLHRGSSPRGFRAASKGIPHPSEVCSFILQNYPTQARTAAGKATSGQWHMAYGASAEVIAGLNSGGAAAAAAAAAARARHHLDLDDACDTLRLSELLRDGGTLDGLDDLGYELTRGGSPGLIGPAPPSPAPNGNGRVPSPAPLRADQELEFLRREQERLFQHHQQAQQPRQGQAKAAAESAGYSSGLTPIPEILPSGLGESRASSVAAMSMANSASNPNAAAAAAAYHLHQQGPLDGRDLRTQQRDREFFSASMDRLHSQKRPGGDHAGQPKRNSLTGGVAVDDYAGDPNAAHRINAHNNGFANAKKDFRDLNHYGGRDTGNHGRNGAAGRPPSLPPTSSADGGNGGPPHSGDRSRSGGASRSMANSIPATTTCSSYSGSHGLPYGTASSSAALVPASSASATGVAATHTDVAVTEGAAGGAGATPLMLWKKVQHCVIYGGHFISSARERAEQQHEQNQREAAEREATERQRRRGGQQQQPQP